MWKKVGIGANVFDTLYNIPTYPTEDTKMRAAVGKTACGGSNATGFVASSKLGEDTAYTLSLAVKKLNPYLIFCGRQTLVGDTA